MKKRYDIVQVAYHVPDIEQAARHMSASFGAGPFFVVRDITLQRAVHRGEDCLFVHSSAYGQWGDIMMELVQQEGEGPSPFRDVYTASQSGLHHVATMVDSLEAAYAHYAEHGYALATEAVTLTGTTFSFIDALEQLGHFIEVYERSESLLGFYAMVREAAEGWDGQDPLRIL